MNHFQIGDLVAHKHYPEKALGKISKFYSSGRVGVEDGCRPRSFLPSSLILCGEKIAPGEVEKLEDAITLSEVMEITPAQDEDFDIDELPSAIAQEEDFDNGCPECGSHDLEATPLGVNWKDKPDYYLLLCTNCAEKWWFVDKLPDSLMPDKSAIANSHIMTLLPVPRDFSDLKQWPEWWEKPALPDIENPDHVIGDDEDDWQYVLEFDSFFKAQYRGWLIEMDDTQIYAGPPSGNKVWWCKCDLDRDGPGGQIAIAQEFVDSWYFAQPSPGQLSLNILEAVARDLPPPPRLTA